MDVVQVLRGIIIQYNYTVINYNYFIFIFSASNDSGKGSLTPSPRTSIGKILCVLLISYYVHMMQLKCFVLKTF